MPEDGLEEIFSAHDNGFFWFALEPFDIAASSPTYGSMKRAIVLDLYSGKYRNAYWSQQTLGPCEAEEAFQWLVAP